MFRRVLIANRGEIACRVIQSCQKLGIETVAVYSEADRGALFVERADLGICIGPPKAADSYLSIPRLVEAARASGAEALHPGYGFLSENADFATACAAAGIVFIGPHPEAIRRMGSKTEARRLARLHGVPVVPGYDGDDQSNAALAAAARAIGTPLMIKASAGGGGRGIRIVRAEAEFEQACEAARREAIASFGDGQLLVERYVREPRHIEVQVIGDRHGGLWHLLERECSIQRRHQKLVEEAPAPNLPEQSRELIFRSALQLAAAIGYDNAGTVEFVLDAESGAPYFLEMNTRLQVEHPVTECVTGLDLVELQLRAAAGERLALRQQEICARGSAIEVRVNAEDPARKFLPRTGTIERIEWPQRPNLRVETGVRSGSEITPHYDSLIAKLIGSGASRDEAIASLVQGLDEVVCFGPENNLGFLRQIVDSAAFRAGRLTTHFLEQQFPQGPLELPEVGIPDVALAALAASLAPPRGALQPAASAAGANAAQGASPWSSLGPWRLLEPAGHPARSDVFVEEGKRRSHVRVLGNGALDFGAGLQLVAARWLGETQLEVECEGRSERVRIARHGDRIQLVRGGRRRSFRILPREEVWATRGARSGARAEAIAAPFPGQVAELRVKVGERVAEGDVVVVLEAMKMLHNLVAAGAGVVAELCCQAGAAVAAGELLVRFESPGALEET